MESREVVTVHQSASNSAVVQTVLAEQVHDMMAGFPWHGHAYPGRTVGLDELTLTNVKFIVSADYKGTDGTVKSDCGPDHGTIKITYIKYEIRT